MLDKTFPKSCKVECFPGKFILLVSTFLFFSFRVAGQNTVGLISYDKDQSYDGYNLFYSHNQSSVYLINNCGEILHTWEDDPDFRPGNVAYLLADGTLVRAKRPNNPSMDSIWAGGGGAIVDLVDWDGNVLWTFEQNDSLRRLHHDIAALPNGNLLLLSWELRTAEEAIQAGRDPGTLVQNKLWPDYIFEIDPSTDSIVWEWHIWDHLIQDFDPTKDNFGVVGDHPELVDINWQTNDGLPDWMHSNSLDYNAELDQIMLSVPAFHELWVIDHSTTTQEAKGHTGGIYGRGGDLLYRWGNPQTYRAPGPQKLFWPHDVHWIDQFLDDSHPHYGKIAIFNNRVNPDYSMVNIINPGFDETSMTYPFDETNGFLPEDFDLALVHPDTFPLHSTGLSNVQILPNKNLLILAGRWGRVFEINPATHQVVWEYVIPLKGGSPVSQGDTLKISNNITFRFNRYPKDFSAFENKDLSPKGYLELNPDITFCDLLTSVEEPVFDVIEIWPNPANGFIQVRVNEGKGRTWKLSDMSGKLLSHGILSGDAERLEVNTAIPGLYILQIEGMRPKKLLIH